MFTLARFGGLRDVRQGWRLCLPTRPRGVCMQKVRQWLRNYLRKWLGIEEDARASELALLQLAETDNLITERVADIKRALDSIRADTERHAIAAANKRAVETQRFVPEMNLRITALEQQSVNGAGAAVIAEEVFNKKTRHGNV